MEKAMRDDALGAERLEESERRKGEVASGPDVAMGQSSSRSSSGAPAGTGEVPASRGTRRTAEDAGLPSLQDHAESRPVQSAGEMRLGELSWETLEVAEVSCPGRLAPSCSLFDMLRLSTPSQLAPPLPAGVPLPAEPGAGGGQGGVPGRRRMYS